jgi:hypothetical protein
MGALVDAASVPVSGMPDTEGDHHPGKSIGRLGEAEDKTEWRV